MSTILIEEENPYGSASAFVEDDGRTVYLYRVSTEGSIIEPAAVWVRNLAPAPEAADDAPSRGMAPLMKRASCAHPEGAPPLRADELDLIWFPDGTGVTLYVNGNVEAVLPPWAGRDYVQGYAKDALGYESATLPLPPSDSGFHERLEENREFWTLRTSGNDWEDYRNDMLAWYERFLGPHTQYYAVDIRRPMLGIARFETPAGCVFGTVGMGRQPQPGIELHRDDPEAVVRTEILCNFPDAPDWAPAVLGRMAAYPWRTGRFFDDGHVYETGRTDPVSGFLLTERPAAAGWTIEIPQPILLDRHYPLHVLFAVPGTPDDITVARAKGVDYRLTRILEKRSSL